MTADYEFESISGLYGRLGRGGHYGQDNQGETGPGPGHSFSVGPRVVVVLLDVSNSMAFPVAAGGASMCSTSGCRSGCR